jgi:hypothetical protein
VDTKAGAVRFWYLPTTLGQGGTATLLSLVSGTGDSAITWWSLVSEGQSITLQCQNGAGMSSCLSVPQALENGTWYLVTIGYTATHTALYLDKELVGTGSGVVGLPANLLPATTLVIGSSLAGTEVACGQIEELDTFSSSGDWRRPDPVIPMA